MALVARVARADHTAGIQVCLSQQPGWCAEITLVSRKSVMEYVTHINGVITCVLNVGSIICSCQDLHTEVSMIQ
jgi:hypothetical protein